MEPFEVVADSRDELEQRLGDLVDLHLGRPHWTIRERSGDDPSAGPDTVGQTTDQQLRLDL